MVGYSIITPSIPLFAKLFKASDASMGYAFAAYPTAFLITIIPFGYIVDKVGKNYIIISMGMFSLAVACLCLVLAESILTFSIARAFQGIGSAASWVAAQPLAAQKIDTSKNKGLEISSITIALGLGMVLGPLLGSIGSLRTPFYINLFLALGIGLLAFISLKGEGIKDRVVSYDYLSIIKRTGIVIACLTIMFIYASVGMMEVLFPLYMDSLDYIKSTIGILFFVLSLFLVVSQPATGKLMDRRGPYVTIFTGSLLASFSLALMILFTSLACWIPVFIVFGIALGMMLSASMLLIAVNSRPGEQGAAYGIWNFSFSVGYLWGPALGGTLSDFFYVHIPSMRFQFPFFLFSVIILLNLCIFKIIISKKSFKSS